MPPGERDDLYDPESLAENRPDEPEELCPFCEAVLGKESHAPWCAAFEIEINMWPEDAAS